ncbi:MAG: PKD domain-containing protein, partial [Flavobacteriales bacterium]
VVINPNPIAQFIADSVCFSYRTNFTDYSLFGPVTWQWSFGDGDSSIIQNPSHLYQTDSIFKVSLFVSNAFGCNDSVINSVIIYDRPVANFGNSVACAKKQTNFYDSSSANPVLWNWDFGDGTIDSSQNPQHIYAVGGNYPVTLIVENASGCIDTITKIVTISTVPQTYFITDSVCFGSPTLFIDSTILNYAPSSYFWNFGDGNFSGLQNPVYQYTSPGTYFASLTVTNINGCDSTFSDSVVVNSTPVSNFIHDTVCYGFATSFIRINSANNPVFYIWNYGDGSPLDTNLAPVVSHNYLSDGAYLVTLTVINNGGCADSSSQTVIVHPTPIARFTPQFDTICLGDSITFLNSSSFATDYFWNFGDGNLDSLAIPVHVYNSAGLFVTTLITENIFGCLDTAFDTLVVLQNPVTNFNLDTVCFANPTTFTNLSSGNNLNWRWNFGDGNTSTLQNPTHIFGFDSTFNVILTATSPFGCATSHSEIAQVLPIVDAQFNSSLACVGRAINFTDSSSGIPNSWRWNFGDGNTSTLQNPIHTYATTGNFTVTLIVINTAGCSDTISRVLFVNSIPVPDFVADTICVGNSMTFVNLTTNTQPVASSFWDFGDGNSSTANNPTYVYAASGIYTVTLTVTNNGGCASSISKLVIVNPNPVADFTHDTVCVGLATTFTDASSGIPIAWQWNFGDFSPIDSTSGSSVSHSYATAGLYTATLNIQSGANGCGNQVIKYITVLDAVDADFTVASPICEGTAVQFVNNSTSTGAGIITTNWNFGDGNKSSVNNPIHNYTGAGVYTVVLSIASSQGCIDSDSTNVLVNPVPVADFDFTKNICIGLPTNFYDSSTVSVGAINSWNWSFGDGNIDSIQNPFNIYNASGTYLVNLQVTTDSGCSDMNSQNVIINPAAVANFTYNSVCVGDTIIFKDQSTVQIPDSIVSWYWEFGDGTSSSVQNPSHQYAGNTQNYLVKLTVTTSFGCLKDTTILVSYLPVPVFNYGPEFFGYCEDEPVTFYDSSVIAAPSTIVAWEWTFRDGNQSFIQNPTHIYDSSGNYFIKLKTTSSDGCVFYDSLAAPLIIYPKPIANFLTVPSVVSVFLPEVYFDNKTTGAVSYIWDFGDGSTGTEFAPRHLFPGIVGFYTTTQYAFSAFGCMDSISNIIYVKEEYTLYAPNSFTPSKDFNKTFLVKGHGITDFNMKIFDRWGELLFETMDLNQGWDGKHKGKDCAVGVYVFLITTRDSEGNDHSKTGHVTLIK